MAEDRRPLTEDEVEEALRRLPGWTADRRGERTGLVRTLRFSTFEDAIHFMAAAARRISVMDHHPEWTNVYSTVTVWLSTHSAGHRPTGKDLALAEYLEALYREYAPE